ncbi:MAG TPA: radical SAM protein [Patescibacteria group bacterium]|nr:radical SAM protein [Patescibacteria group bacterium]
MNDITFYIPGSRHYDNGLWANHEHSFTNISITGTKCRCLCEHCRGKMLGRMLPVSTPEELLMLAESLHNRGCRGVLVSGGADEDGSVPLKIFADALRQMTAMGLAVVVHPGLLSEQTAAALAQANVSRVALDLIGDKDTIREVYHLPYLPADYRNSLRTARSQGLPVSPHIVIGLHFGQIRGEYQALNMVAAEGATSLVLVVLNPLTDTPMTGVNPPSPAEVANLFREARRLLPALPIALGCARPMGEYARRIEKLAVDAGMNAIAYPARETVDYVTAKQAAIHYEETCCGMVKWS